MTDLTSPTSNDSEFPSNSIFGNLAAKHKQIQDGLLLTRRIPHWEDPEIWAVYRPVQSDELEQVAKKTDKMKSPLRTPKAIAIASDTLILACVEVFGVIEGKEYSFGSDPHGQRTRFDAEMAKRFEMDDLSARAVVRKLFFNDGDLFNAAAALNEWSGLGNDETDEGYAGE